MPLACSLRPFRAKEGLAGRVASSDSRILCRHKIEVERAKPVVRGVSCLLTDAPFGQHVDGHPSDSASAVAKGFTNPGSTCYKSGEQCSSLRERL